MPAILPLRDLVYVLPLDDPDMIGSIIVPEEAKQRTDQGIVFVRPRESELRVGDHVLFSGYTGTEITVEGIGRLIVFPEQFVEAVIDSDVETHPVFPLHLIDMMVKRTEGNMIALGYDRDLIQEFTERFHSFLHDHLFAELQF